MTRKQGFTSRNYEKCLQGINVGCMNNELRECAFPNCIQHAKLCDPHEGYLTLTNTTTSNKLNRITHAFLRAISE